MLPWMLKYPYQNDEILNLDWVLEHVKNLIKQVDSLESWKSTHEKEYQELKSLYDAIVSGNFPPEMEKALFEWTVKNSADIINELTKMVFFGITEDGYFVAYIPETWDDVIFNTTGLDINVDLMPEYGHLVLSY